MIVIKEMTIEELQGLKQKIELELRERQEKQDNEYEFDFDGQGYVKKSPPYCARLYFDSQTNKIEREFFKTERSYYKNKIHAVGKIKAREGDIIEEQKGYSSGKFRFVSIVRNSQMVMIGDYYNPTVISQVKGYLNGSISLKEFNQFINQMNKRKI